MEEKIIYSLIVDKSSSMHEIRNEIFDGINNRIKKIKQIGAMGEQEVYADITLFNQNVQRIKSLTPSNQLSYLEDSDYRVNGMTALYDAIGSTLERLYHTFGDAIKDGKTKAVVVIYTDGYENASRMYTKKQIQQMLSAANKMPNVEVSIVGCDESTITMADQMNFKRENIVRVDKQNFGKTMRKMDVYFDDFRKEKKSTFKESLKDYDKDL